MLRIFFPTQFGVCGVGWHESGITRFQLPSTSEVCPKSEVETVPEWISALIKRVQRHMAGDLGDFSDVVLDWSQVSAFQKSVYQQTLTIKAGQTRTYGQIASQLGLGKEGARAVGTALGNNPWPLIVPCHRVVAADGRMTGFSSPGGIRTKTRLLTLEGAELLSE